MNGQLRQTIVRTTLNLLFIACVCAPSRTVAQTSVTFTVSSNADDASQTTGGTMYVNDNLIYMSEYTGFRFQNVSIPAGAIITSATLDIYASGGGTTSFSVDIMAEDIDNASAFTSTSYNISNRTRTSAETLWTVSSGSFTDGVAFTSPDFSSSIQEVIDRGGWSSGNSLVVITTPNSGNKGVRQRDSGSSYAAQLHVTYTAADLEPIVHWDFNETSGDAVNRGSLGSSADASLIGSVSQNSRGLYGTGTALRFDGGQVTPGSVTDLNSGGPWSKRSISLWFKADETTTRQVLYCEGGTTRELVVYVEGGRLYIAAENRANDDGAGNAAPWGNPPIFISSAQTVEAGRTYHVAAVLDGTFTDLSGELRGYLNGKEFAATNGIGGFWPHNQARVGAAPNLRYHDNTTGSGYAFTGVIDDVRIYNAALTDEQVIDLYGLIAHWAFDEGTGTTIADSSPNVSNASFNAGTPAWVTGVRGNALQFNGSNDATTDTEFEPPANGTVAFWYRFNQAPTGSERLFGAGGDWEVRADANGVLYGDLGGDGIGGAFQTPSSVAEANRWHHFAAVYSADGDSFKIYLDGQLVADGSMSLNVQIANTLSFGTRTGSTQRFNGALDDFRVYNYELSVAQIAELYGLIGHWKLDAASGTVAVDESGLGNDGTLNNSPAWTGGVRGGALSFDGSNDHVEVPHDSAFLSDEGTVAFWFKANDVSSDQGLFSKDSSGFDTGGHLTISLDNNYVQVRQQSSSASHTITGSSTITTGRWYFVTYQWGTGGMRLLVDGVEVATKSSYTGGLGTSSGGSGNFEPIAIGANTWQSGNLTVNSLNQYFDGNIDDVRFYNLRLSDYQIAELYGLVAHWKLDELSGTTAYDSSGMDHHATLTGTEGWSEGQVDGGFAFDYIDGEEYFVAPNTTTLDDLQESDYSVVTWFKPLSIPPGTGSDNDASYAPLSKGGYNLGFLYDENQQFYSEHWLSSGPTWSGAGTWSDTYATGKFYHVASVVSVTDGTAKIYVNGVLMDTANFTPGDPSYDYGSTPWRIGVSVPGGGTWGHPTHGVVDDARLYNRALSDEEIADIYSSGKGPGVRIISWQEIANP